MKWLTGIVAQWPPQLPVQRMEIVEQIKKLVSRKMKKQSLKL